MTDLLPEEQVTKTTYNSLARLWSSEHNTPGFWQEEMQRFHSILPSGKVLEIGAGGGRDAQELVALGYQYVGTDISKGLLKVAQNKLPNQQFYEKSVYELDFNEELFDGFWASAVLLHIPKARINDAIAKIKSVLNRNAIGFISIKDGVGERIEIEEIGGERLERFFAYWSKDDFLNVLTIGGFETIDYTYRPMSANTKWHCFFVKSL